MRRRQFIGGLAGAAVWPLVAGAQQPSIPVIGFLRSTSLAPFQNLVTAFSAGLREAGLVEGHDVLVEYRYADNQIDRLPTLAAELIRRPVAVIVGNSVAASTAKAATATVPIIVVYGGDPVREGFVASLNRPGGNITGVVFFNAVVGAKRLELLRQVVPRANVIGMLVNPGNPMTEADRTDVQAAAQAVGQQLIALDVSSENDIEKAIANLVQRGAGVLLVGTGPFLTSVGERLVALSARYALPTVYIARDAVLAGGLMSYGASMADAYRQAGIYAGRVVNGEKPGDLPVVQSNKLEFVINLKTAQTLGLDVPAIVLARADEVIE